MAESDRMLEETQRVMGYLQFMRNELQMEIRYNKRIKAGNMSAVGKFRFLWRMLFSNSFLIQDAASRANSLVVDREPVDNEAAVVAQIQTYIHRDPRNQQEAREIIAAIHKAVVGLITILDAKANALSTTSRSL